MSESISAGRRGGAATIVSLALLCLLAFVLRWNGIGYLLPVVTHLDATVIVHQAEEIRSGTLDPAGDPHAAYYPHLLARAIALLPDAGRTGIGPPRDRDEHLRLASAPWEQARLVSVLLSLLAIPGTWLLARRFLGAGWAWLAAALMATSLVHAVFSTQERPHGTAASFILLSLLASLRLRTRGDPASYLLAGLAAGLAVGSLHYGVFALPALGAAVLLREKRERRASAWWVLAAAAILALFVVWLYPFHFAGREKLLTLGAIEGERAFHLSGQPLFLEKFTGRGFLTHLETLWSYDPALLLGVLLGAVAAVAAIRHGGVEPRARRDLAVVLAFVVPYLVVTGMYAETWERFMLALLPPVCVFAASGVRAIAGRPGLAVAVALPSLALVPLVQLGRVRSAPSTLELAADWVREGGGAREPVVVVPYLDLPLLHGEGSLAENARRPWASEWIEYQAALDPSEFSGERHEVLIVPGARAAAMEALASDPLAYLAGTGARFAVLQDVDPAESALLAGVRDAARGRLERVGRFSPEREDSGGNRYLSFRYTGDPWRAPFVRVLLESARMGPTLEIYRIPGD